jgi:hypothetical protein
MIHDDPIPIELGGITNTIREGEESVGYMKRRRAFLVKRNYRIHLVKRIFDGTINDLFEKNKIRSHNHSRRHAHLVEYLSDARDLVNRIYEVQTIEELKDILPSKSVWLGPIEEVDKYEMELYGKLLNEPRQERRTSITESRLPVEPASASPIVLPSSVDRMDTWTKIFNKAPDNDIAIFILALSDDDFWKINTMLADEKSIGKFKRLAKSKRIDYLKQRVLE